MSELDAPVLIADAREGLMAAIKDQADRACVRVGVAEIRAILTALDGHEKQAAYARHRRDWRRLIERPPPAEIDLEEAE